MKYDQVVIQYLNSGISDDSLLVLNIGGSNISGGRPFRFFNHLLDYPGFVKIVATKWGKDARGVGFGPMLDNLKGVKHMLKDLHRVEYAGVAHKIGYWQEQTEKNTRPYGC